MTARQVGRIEFGKGIIEQSEMNERKNDVIITLFLVNYETTYVTMTTRSWRSLTQKLRGI